jgi:pimeloyl-ACP methyl ester carboxylesterase
MDRSAIVVPGGGHGSCVPLLMYAAGAARARGAHVRGVEWDPPYDPNRSPLETVGPWVARQIPPLCGRPLLIGKSLGTVAASIAAERRLPAVWLTPLLTVDWVLGALRRVSAPVLLVGGTADKYWDGRLARERSPHVLEVEGANHGTYTPGRLANAAAVLGRVVTAVEDFLDDTVWPASPGAASG